MRFRLVPKSTTLVEPEMTLDCNYALRGIHTFVSEPVTKICMKIDPYYQQQKCSPGILVSRKVIFIRIFVGVRWRGASNESVIVVHGDFRFIRSLSSEHFTNMATRQLSGDTTVSDLGHISRSLNCFTSKTVCDTAKVTIDY